MVIKEYSDKEKAAILKQFRDMEGRAMRRIMRRARILRKDKKLQQEMEKEIRENFNI